MARSIHRRKPRKVISVIVEGQTEKWYLDLMKSHEDIPRIDIKPELPKKKKLGDIKNNGSVIFWAIMQQ